MTLLCGIDIGGTKIAIGLGDREGNILAQDRILVDPDKSAQELLAEVSLRLGELASGRSFSGVGVGVPGPLDAEAGLILNAVNLPGWADLPIRDILQDSLKVPVLIENDANAAAMGEFLFGAGRGVRDMVYVTVSTGIGGGVITDGKLLRGVRGSAGEVGHMTILPDGPLCNCGNHGCFEALASGTAIARRAREGLEKGEKSSLRGQKISTFAISNAVRAGDPFARRIWEESIFYLACGIGNIIAVLAPQRIVIGGGVANVGDLLFLPLREELKKRVCVAPLEKIEVVPAKNVNDAGLLGALAVACGVSS